MLCHDAEFPFGELGCHGLSGERGDDGKSGEGAFEGADVVGVLLDEQINGLGGDVVSVHGGRHAQDRRSGFERWGVETHHDAGLQTGDEGLRESFEVFGCDVAGDDDAFAGLVEAVEGVEELFEGGFLAAEELDVVDQEDVDLAVASVEFGDAALALAGVLEGVDEFVGEFL